jgi:hypothetical protein
LPHFKKKKKGWHSAGTFREMFLRYGGVHVVSEGRTRSPTSRNADVRIAWVAPSKFAYHSLVGRTRAEMRCYVSTPVGCGYRRTSVILRGVLRSTKHAIDDERWHVACLDMLRSEATMSCIPLVITPMSDLFLTSTISVNTLFDH